MTCLASSGGGVLTTGSETGTVTLWDVTRRRRIAGLQNGATPGVTCVAVSPDGRAVAAGGARLTTWTRT
ncbi:hypothetical protein K8Z49_35835 [Actinomadura madurae]